jgi:hypothetical protein
MDGAAPPVKVTAVMAPGALVFPAHAESRPMKVSISG